MRVVNQFNQILKGFLSIGAVVSGVGSAQAAQRPSIDPMTFCSNSCNDRCNAQDPLAPKLKAQCQKICSDKIDQVASLQMSKMPGDMGKIFRTSRDAAAKKVMMMENAPIYKCLGTPAVAEVVTSETTKITEVKSPVRNIRTQKTDTRSAAQRESDALYEASLKAAAEQNAVAQEPVVAEVQPGISVGEISQDIQIVKDEIKGVEAKLDQLSEKINPKPAE